MVTARRWNKAQEYERGFWENVAKKIASGALRQLDWYSWKASELEKRLAALGDATAKRTGKVLEIGSGPVGIVNFLESWERFAIDPLEDFYRESQALTQLRRSGVTYLNGTGEHLPFEDGFFSLVIVDNVIDHTLDPSRILREVHRVLERNGLLYLAVNVHTRWGAIAHKILAASYIDKGHPYTFTQEGIGALLVKHQFTIRQTEIADYKSSREKNCQSKNLKDRIKGYSGLSEFAFCAIAAKGQ